MRYKLTSLRNGYEINGIQLNYGESTIIEERTKVIIEDEKLHKIICHPYDENDKDDNIKEKEDKPQMQRRGRKRKEEQIENDTNNIINNEGDE